jgi:hypothetical protein
MLSGIASQDKLYDAYLRDVVSDPVEGSDLVTNTVVTGQNTWNSKETKRRKTVIEGNDDNIFTTG